MKAQLGLSLLLVLRSGAACGGGAIPGAAQVVGIPRGLRGPLLDGASLRWGASGAGLRGGEGSTEEDADPVPGVFSHDFGTGDYGDEKWRRANAKLDNLGPVTRVPEDVPRVDLAIERILNVRGRSTGRLESILAIGPGSFLLPKRFKQVAVPDEDWPYEMSHPAIWLDGKCTRAKIPDDGAEAQHSPEYPVDFLPTRDTRFVNVTGSVQVIGHEGMRSRVGGAWRLCAVGAGGWFRELTLVNQEESVMVVDAGDWKIEGCLLSASSRGIMGSDILVANNRCMLLLYLTTIQPLWPGDANPSWAEWPPGEPKNGGGFNGETQVPACENAMPQRGYVMYGLHARGVSKVTLDTCTIQGCVVAAAASGATDLQIDRSRIRWNQFGILGEETGHAIVRDTDMLDNVYGAFKCNEAKDVEGTTFSLLCCHVRGPLWAGEYRPLNFDEADNEVEPSKEEFTSGPGRHLLIPDEDPYQPGAGEWNSDWNTAPGFEWVPPLGEVAPENPNIDVPLSNARREAIVHSLTVEERNAPEVPPDPPQKAGFFDGDRGNDE